MSQYTLLHDLEKEQYEFRIDEYIAVLNYKTEQDGILAITHVGVPSELGGRGIGSQLVEAVLIDIEKQGLKIRPICPFVVAHIERRPEWKHLVAINS